MTKLLVLSGKKQSGKTSTARYLFGMEMVACGLIDYFRMDADGDLLVPVTQDTGIVDGVFDPESRQPEVVQFLAGNVWPFIKMYSFADLLKQHCMSVLGLTYEQCYGTNAQKDELTQYTWENMPGACTDFVTHAEAKLLAKYGVHKKPKGQLTARQIMQHIGNLYRVIDPDIWVRGCLRQIEIEQPEMAVIVDCRYPNEVQRSKEAGGKVLRFLRSVDSDEHDSETSLDLPYDQANFDGIIDNRDMTLEEKNAAIHKQLYLWGYVKVEVKPDVSPVA